MSTKSLPPKIIRLKLLWTWSFRIHSEICLEDESVDSVVRRVEEVAVVSVVSVDGLDDEVKLGPVTHVSLL
jgi:hypothetical protein